MPYNSYRFSCEHVQLKRLSFLSKLSIILNCHSEKGPFLSTGEGILCQTAASLAGHTRTHVHTCTHTLLPQRFQPPRATGADPSRVSPPQSVGCPPACVQAEQPVPSSCCWAGTGGGCPQPCPTACHQPRYTQRKQQLLQPLGRAGQALAAASSRLPRGWGAPALTTCRDGLRTPSCPSHVAGTREHGSLGIMLVPGQPALHQPARCRGRSRAGTEGWAGARGGLSHGAGNRWSFLNFCWFDLCVPFCGALHTWGRWASWREYSQLLPPFPQVSGSTPVSPEVMGLS